MLDLAGPADKAGRAVNRTEMSRSSSPDGYASLPNDPGLRKRVVIWAAVAPDGTGHGRPDPIAWRERAPAAPGQPLRRSAVTEMTLGPGEGPIQVTPVVVLVQTFPARPSSIPDIRDFVRRCLAESPLNEEGTREVGETVFRALLDAAGPTGSIQVAFRIFPEHVEVDVLHSEHQVQPLGAAPNGAGSGQPAEPGAVPVTTRAVPPDTSGAVAGPGTAATMPGAPGPADTFAEWMSTALRREGLTQEAAARMLGVSVKTVSRWVGGATEPRMRDLRRIQEVFGEIPIS